MTTAFPLSWPDGWPRTDRSKRAASRFRTHHAAAYDDLLNELRLLRATGVVVSSNAALRRDGRPYAEAIQEKHDDPGVAVYWTDKDRRPRVMARDAHLTPAENLRAIGLVIEALRSIDRHGGSFMMERAFAGFVALPAPEGSRPWHELLDVSATASRAEISQAFRAKAATAHPDTGGSHDAMAALTAARDAGFKAVAS